MKLLINRLNRDWSYIVILSFIVALFFWKFIFQGLLPIPADTIVGMYHPWRDNYAADYPRGIPFKNFLITDPVRQQYPWRQLVIEGWKNKNIPTWNPYNLSGTPLLANSQSAPFYIFNILFFIFNFSFAWGILIVFQPLLAGIFLYYYLRELRLHRLACLIGSICFSFGGFSVAWLEWGTVIHTGLWLPLILLSIEKISKLSKKVYFWSFVFMFSLSQSLFAGHLQVFFYVFLSSFIYLIWKTLKTTKKWLISKIFIIMYSVFLFLTAIQWLPTLEFIKLSARGLDQIDWHQPGWFLPWQNLVQFLVPDFFGNPSTLNYFGIWNYGEFIGYIGVIPLILVLLVILNPKNKFTIYYLLFTIICLSFALPTPWAKLPYWLKIPLLSTSQPTRLLFLVNFGMAVLAAFGLNQLLKNDNKVKKGLSLLPIYLFLWLIAWGKHWPISQRNLILPTVLLIAGGGLLILRKINMKLVVIGIIILTIFDLFRFGWKFTPFTKSEYLFPATKTVEFLKNDQSIYRVMATDRRILPPNFGIINKIQTIDGYDPLYLQRYGELITAIERDKPDIQSPFGFNRIITPQNYQSRLIDLMNVKYVLSLTDLSSPKLGLVFKEGETRVYFNQEYLPRTFFVYNYRFAENSQQAIELMFDKNIDFKEKVIFEENLSLDVFKPVGSKGVNSVKIESYQPNEVIIDARTEKKGILVLTDSYYANWKAFVDDQETEIYRADYNFRAIIVPKGEHKIRYAITH